MAYSEFVAPCRDGNLHFRQSLVVPEFSDTIILLIPGAFRNAQEIAPFAQRLSALATTFTTSLPGFGGSLPLFDASVEIYAENYLMALENIRGNRDVVLVGESLGGLVAMQMAKISQQMAYRHVVALDPPLTMSKQWAIQKALDASLSRQINYPALEAFAYNIFGYAKDSALTEKLYFHLFENGDVPIDLVTGTEPLFPVRNDNDHPCVLDEADLFISSGFSNVRTHKIEGGTHLLVHTVPSECQEIVRIAVTRSRAKMVLP